MIDYFFESFGSEYSYHIKKDYMINMLGSIHIKNSVFIINLLQDEQELSLRMLDMSLMYL